VVLVGNPIAQLMLPHVGQLVLAHALVLPVTQFQETDAEVDTNSINQFLELINPSEIYKRDKLNTLLQSRQN